MTAAAAATSPKGGGWNTPLPTTHNYTFFAGKGAFSTLPFPFRRTYENREWQQRRKKATKTDFGTNDGGSKTDRTYRRRRRIEEEEEEEILLFPEWLWRSTFLGSFLFGIPGRF